MKYRSIFDIIGPVMVGPSSSHTAGAVRLGHMARGIFGHEPTKLHVTFYRSFAETYKGHGTDVAVVSGVLNMMPDDPNIPQGIELANERGIELIIDTSDDPVEMPNTVRLQLSDDKHALDFVGVSIGGGMIEATSINGFEVHIDDENPALLIEYLDQAGIIARVTARLAVERINISQMSVTRKARGSNALMVISTDQKVPDVVVRSIQDVPGIELVITLE